MILKFEFGRIFFSISHSFDIWGAHGSTIIDGNYILDRVTVTAGNKQMSLRDFARTKKIYGNARVQEITS